MNLKAAAAALNVSEKTVSRYASSGRLPQRYVKGKTGRQLDFDEADIARLKEELEAPIERAIIVDGQPSQEETGQDVSLSVLAPSAPVDAQIGALAQLVRAVMDAEQGQTRQADIVAVAAGKMLLSLEEASTLTGLSAARLRTAIAEKKLIARKIGRAWKMRRSDVERFVDSIFEETNE